jgi:tetratricopeptide (TPR) repeat protein
MKRKGLSVFLGFWAAVLILLTLFRHSWAQTDCPPWVARVVSIQGGVQVQKSGMTNWEEVHMEEMLCPGDTIRVQEYGRAAVVLQDETVVRLDQKTAVTVKAPDPERRSFLDLLRGVFHFFSRTPRRLQVATPFVNGSVEGTEFLVTVEADQASFLVYEGRVLVANNAGSVILGKGESATARPETAPIRRIVVRPRDAVQWAVYYPPVLDLQTEDFAQAPVEWQRRLREAVELARSGEPSRALLHLRDAPQPITDARFFAFRASLLLQVGRVDKALPDIQEALRLNPDSGDAYALQTILAVIRNEKDEALVFAEKSVTLAPDSPAPRIALSYALQARADLKKALSAAQQATERAPQDGLAWARLSELWLSFGDLDKSLDAARQAEELNPNISRIQTVLGFAYLAQVKTEQARKAFEEAIRRDPADPLARLGQGLALIREGSLDQGRAEIEIAAGLDPNNAIFRSYLGKAYFEEKRDALASNQYAIAKELDPLDPTPWFYDAIHKQLLNRPVEALQDIQKSIELNDNRAVYRSRLFLDQDLAARSASLGRIYGDLGFQQLALVEGWKSLSSDPSDYSAHRLLAESYSALPRHEIARVSELLQSQLLQPINISPVQPSLAEKNLFVVEGAGPSEPALNEFNPLFLRNRLALQGSGVMGSNDTLGEEIIHSGLWGRFSYSLGQFHYETAGFRDNNDLEQDIYDAFFQMSLSHKTSLQGEFRYEDLEKGDLTLRFDPEAFTPSLRQKEQSQSFRLGFHHAFSPTSDLIASLVYKDAEFKSGFGVEIPPFPPALPFPIKQEIRLDTEEDGYLAEMQHQFHRERFAVISGIGYFDSDIEEEEATASLSPPAPKVKTKTEEDTQHANFYIYSQLKYPETVTWTLGASLDKFDGRQVNRDQLNPKFGISWDLTSTTTLRAAAFRILKRSLISSQTIEPTQVAGFNQFFDDPEGTDSWAYGAALDQKLTRHLYGGVQFVRRDMDIRYRFTQPILNISENREADWEDHYLRAYLYWTPHPWFAVSTEYQYEDLDRGRFGGLENVISLETHRFSPGISFFHPSGVRAQVKPTYVDQEGKFGSPAIGVPAENGSDEFWVWDAFLGYRLPRRYGFLSIEGFNLLDERFQFSDRDPRNPAVYPDRLILLRLTLSF